jgi:hypothetical protein
MSSRQERVAKNEVVFREINERIIALDDGLAGKDNEPLVIVCECGDVACHERVEVTRAEYEEVREEPTHFIVRAGHEDLTVARVVGQENGFVVEEKHGDAAVVAEEHDPRS